MEGAFEDLNDWLETSNMPHGKKQVLKAAISLFSKKGYDGTSTAEIAKVSGMSQATIFKYYKSKEELLLVILNPLIDHLLPTYGQQFVDELSNQKQDLKGMIHFIVWNRYQFLVKNQDIVLILISQVLINDEIKEKVFQKVNDVKDILEKNIWGRLKATGSIRDDVELLSFLRLIVSQILFFFLQNQRFANHKESNEAIQLGLQQIEDSVLRSIQK